MWTKNLVAIKKIDSHFWLYSIHLGDVLLYATPNNLIVLKAKSKKKSIYRHRHQNDMLSWRPLMADDVTRFSKICSDWRKWAQHLLNGRLIFIIMQWWWYKFDVILDLWAIYEQFEPIFGVFRWEVILVWRKLNVDFVRVETTSNSL